MKVIKLAALVAIVLLLLIVSCGEPAETPDIPTSTPTPAPEAAPPSGIEKTPPEEPSDSAPLIAFNWHGGEWHNYFTFEITDFRLRYEAIRYDYYLIDSDSINNVKPGDFTAYVGTLWGTSNTCFLVYVSKLTKKLYYKVIDPYAIPGKERCYMGATHEGILEGYAKSLPANYVRFTYWGKYGVHVNWTDNYGQGHYAVIDQWDGVTEKGYSAADDRPAVRDPTARGRVLPRPDYLEVNRETQEAEGAIVNWVREDDNHLELKFNRTGGSVTGSFWWRHSMNFHWPQAEPGWPAGTIISIYIGDLTGTYSGGETGSFEGNVTGSATASFNGYPSNNCIGSLDGTWTAEMDASGQISGTIHYTVTYAGSAFEDWLDFEATLE